MPECNDTYKRDCLSCTFHCERKKFNRPFEVLNPQSAAQTVDALEQFLATNSKLSANKILSEQHKKYFEQYFLRVLPKTIIIEYEYIDHDYLSDYSSYYVRCFKTYHRKCARIHFFRAEISPERFESWCTDNIIKVKEVLTSNDNYLGFVVARPLPKAVIGRTCLSVCINNPDRESVTITRPYSVNLFGTTLKLDTLAFQQQDKVVSACATSALWSAFQNTGKLFHHAFLSPVEITRIAGESIGQLDRNFPNTGLSPEQLAMVIRHVGLEPQRISAKSLHVLQYSVRAYLNLGIPLVVLCRIADCVVDQPDEKNSEDNFNSDDFVMFTHHFVTISGYQLDSKRMPKLYDECLEPNNASQLEPTEYADDGLTEDMGLSVHASRITDFYAHDDGIGPFTRMRIAQGGEFKYEDYETGETGDFYHDYTFKSMEEENFLLAPVEALAPVYHKIRIPIDLVYDEIEGFDTHYKQCIKWKYKTTKLNPGNRLIWDIKLTTVNRLKEEIINDGIILGEQRRDILTRSYPKYLWVASAWIEKSFDCKKNVIDIIFDATEISDGNFLFDCIEYDTQFKTFFREIPGAYIKYNPSITSENGGRILEWFLNH